MLRYVPDFIYSKSRTGELSGTIDAYVLFIDVAEFTTISNELRKEGKRGAEALNQFLSTALTYPIEQVELNGGFVSHFAGDAFCAVFPGTNAAKLRSAVDAIRKQHVSPVMFKTDMGDYPIKLRITVSCGTLNWNIYPSERQHEYVFSGKPLLEIKSLGKQKQDLALSEAVRMAFIEAQAFDEEAIPADEQNKPEQTANFISKRLQSANPANEIRDGAYCFVNLSYLPKDGIESALALMHEKLDDYGGYLNKLDDSDKGLVALILFGIPKGMGNTLERACRFSLELVKELPKLSMGLSCGNAYAGYVGSETTREYTALGSAVNLASRLMQKASWGEILTDSYLEQEMHYKYQFESADTLTLKGFAAPVHCHRLIDRLPVPPQSFMSELVGREMEVEQIRQTVQQSGSRIMYISGEPGVGKSRLIIEAMKPYPNRYFLFCDPSGHKLLEPIKQFLRQHFAFDSLLSREVNQRSFREQWSKLAGEDKELQRIESIVGDLLGYEWERSIWSMLPPNERPEQQKKAFATLLARIAETDKIIIHLDDPQWIDAMDTEYFRQLGIAKIDNIVIIAACRYLDDGSTVDLAIPNCEARHLELTRLSEEAAVRLIRHLLKVETLPPETQDWIVKKADGNPLFIEQVVAYLKENDCFDGDYKLKGNLDYLSSFGIADIIGSRIDSLTEAVRNTLQHACVLGLEFNTRVLSEMLSRKLDDDLGEGKQARVWADIDELRYIFTHVLIKDTAYNRMMSDKLKTLHLLAAETMERMYHDDEKALNEHSEEIAGHFENAGLEEKAAEYYNRAGCWYSEVYDFPRSENSLTKAVDFGEKVWGERHIKTSKIIGSLAMVYKSLSKHKEAELLFKRVISIREKLLGSLDADTAWAYNDMASHYLETGDYVQAEYYHLKAVKIREQLTVKTDLGNSYNNMGFLYSELAKYELAETYYQRAIDEFEKVYGTENEHVATTLNNMACLKRKLGQYEKAEKLFLTSHEVHERLYGAENPKLIETLNNLAGLCEDCGQYQKAEMYYDKALHIVLGSVGKSHKYAYHTCNNLGCLYRVQGKLHKAEEMLKDSLDSVISIYGERHFNTAVTMANLAALYYNMGNYEEAITTAERAHDIAIDAVGRNHDMVANLTHNIGVFYESKGDIDKAKVLFSEALQLRKRILGDDHPLTLSTLNSIASIHARQGQYKEAEVFASQVLDLRRRLLGEMHPLVANSLNTLAVIYKGLKMWDKSEELFKKALDIRLNQLAESHPDIAFSLGNLASLYMVLERYEEAKILLLKALEINQVALNSEHPETQDNISNLFKIYEKLNQPDKAAEYKAMLISPTEDK